VGGAVLRLRVGRAGGAVAVGGRVAIRSGRPNRGGAIGMDAAQLLVGRGDLLRELIEPLVGVFEARLELLELRRQSLQLRLDVRLRLEQVARLLAGGLLQTGDLLLAGALAL